MAVGDRSLSDVLRDIVGNVQEIVRSEVRLAKAEIREDAAKARSSAMLLGAGAVTAGFSILFILVTIVDRLALVVPFWAAALIVGAALGIIASVLLSAGVKRSQLVHIIPERTVQTMKENIEWAKQHAK